MIQEFATIVKNVNTDYKESDAWPVFLDNFIEFMKEQKLVWSVCFINNKIYIIIQFYSHAYRYWRPRLIVLAFFTLAFLAAIRYN
jgi:hypothetical protein